MAGAAFLQEAAPDLLLPEEPASHLCIRYQPDLLARVRVRSRAVVAVLHDLSSPRPSVTTRSYWPQSDSRRSASRAIPTQELIRRAFVVAETDRHPSHDRPRITFDPALSRLEPPSV